MPKQIPGHEEKCSKVVGCRGFAARMRQRYSHTLILCVFPVLQEIFTTIRDKLGDTFVINESEEKATQIILITSASGGVGKTTDAMGIASVLAAHMKKVLYINVDYLQTFQSLLLNQMPIMEDDYGKNILC